MEGPAPSLSEHKYGQLYTHTYNTVQLKPKLQNMEPDRPQPDCPRRLCYRPAVFFRHLRLTALSFPQGNILPRVSNLLHFFSVCAKYRKASISFVTSFRPPRRNNSPPTGRIFMKFDIWVFF